MVGFTDRRFAVFLALRLMLRAPMNLAMRMRQNASQSVQKIL
jgi:hypothetical protein